MPKLKWGIDPDEIDSQEPGQGFTPYDGPLPKPGVYAVALKKVTATESKAGNPMIKVLAIIDGAIGKNNAEYDGAPLWDQIVVMGSTAWKVRQFTDALGVSGSDFVNRTVADDDGNITKIGNQKIDDSTRIRVQVKYGKDQDGNKRAEIGSYLVAVDAGSSKSKDDEPEPEPEPEPDEPVTAASEDEEEAWAWEHLTAEDRNGLKRIIKEESLEIKVTKSMSDDDLRAAVAKALGVTPSSESDEEDDEEDDEPPF